MTKHCLTPLAAVAGGLLAGVVGTVCLDTVQYLKYRRVDGTDSPLAWEFAPVRTWEQAPDPGQVARWVIEGFTQRKLPGRWAFPVSTAMHWVVETMSAGTGRPVIFPVSNPTSQIEAMPADIIGWSRGKALVATGLPIPPVDYAGVRYRIGQANNALLYPGLGLGTIVAGASKVTDGMLLAAAEAVAGQADVGAPGASLLPAVENVRASSATTAIAVARAAADDGVATRKTDDIVQTVQDAIWQPAYPDSV